MIETPIERIDVAAYRVPTDEPESDGTLEWDATTAIVVHAHSGDVCGLGYTYGSAATAVVIESELRPVVLGRDAADTAGTWAAMGRAIRNAGRRGVGMMAVAAVDIALWDLRAKLRDLPLIDVLPRFRTGVAVYGSGGFTSYTLGRLQEQLGGWAEQGIPRVKMKFGREPEHDPDRLDAARKAIGDDVELYVDANGAFAPKTAVGWAERLRGEWRVSWFEEPVSSEDPGGMRFVRERSPGGLDVAAGEYGAVLADFGEMVDCVDCLQADVTRCGGITGLLQVGGLAVTHEVDISAHCAPAISAHAFCAVPRVRHLEYFHDHIRVEHLLFDGVVAPVGGQLLVDRDRPGHGLALKAVDAERYRVH